MFNSFKTDHDHAPNGHKNGEFVAGHAAAGDIKSMATMPSASKATQANHSIVDENLTMKGDLESDGDVMVKGKVLGNIKCNLLIVDRDATIEGGINAIEVIVRGKVKGKVDADRVRLERTADVDCDIVQKSFSAEEGARIKGSLVFKSDTASSSTKGKPALAATSNAAEKPGKDNDPAA